MYRSATSNDSDVGRNLATDAAMAAGSAVAGAGAVYVVSRATSRNALRLVDKRDVVSEELKHVSENMDKMKQEISYLKEEELRKSLPITKTEEIHFPPNERKKIYETLLKQLPADTVFSPKRITTEDMSKLLQILGKWYLQDGGGLAMSSSTHSDFRELKEALIDVLKTRDYNMDDYGKTRRNEKAGDPSARIEKALSKFIISLREDLNQEEKSGN